MSDARNLKFLARGPYRKRRLRDLGRSLPIFGAVLISIPLLWSVGAPNSRAILYLFGVWLLLIAVAGLVSVFTANPTEDEPQ